MLGGSYPGQEYAGGLYDYTTGSTGYQTTGFVTILEKPQSATTAFSTTLEATRPRILVQESMQSSPSTGTSFGNGSTAYNSTGHYFVLNTTGNDQYGGLDYTMNPLPVSGIDVAFDFWAGGGSGADAVYFYYATTGQPQAEDQGANGYVIAYDEFHDQVQLYFNTSILATYSVSNLDNSTWRTARITVSGNTFHIFLDGTEVITYTDSSRTLTGTHFGWGGRTGGLDNEHRVRNLLVVSSGDGLAVNANLEKNVLSTTALTSRLEETVSISTSKNYVVNPDFETNDFYWGIGGTATKAQDSTESYIGTHSLKMIGSAIDDRVYVTVTDGLTPVVGQSYTFSVYLKGSGTVRLWGYDGSSDSFSSNITLSSTWTRYTLTFTAQATSSLYVGVRQNASGACTCYIDAAQLEPGASASSFFDGAYGGSWDGTAQSSTSTRVNNRLAIFADLQAPTLHYATAGLKTTIETSISRQTSFYKAIHTGSYSIDYNSLTQTQIDACISAIVTTMPSVTHIAIGTYLDYASQISMWASAIHAAGRKVWHRSAGFTTWSGVNGSSPTGTPTQHRADIVTWIQTNQSIFQPGDIFECIPDEAEGGYYYQNTQPLGTTPGNADFNTFITGAISDCQAKFAALGISGINTTIVFTNASAARDIITGTTAATLTCMGTDDYPESGITDATGQAAAMLSELNTWIVGQHSNKPYHITFGPNVYNQLSQQVQADTLSAESNIIISKLGEYSQFYGLTVWQFGNEANDPKSRLFDYTGGVWVPRSAAYTWNNIMTAITPATIGALSTLEKQNVLSTTALKTSLESSPVSKTVALLSTLEKQSLFTFALSTTLQSNGINSTSALLTLLESAQKISPLAVSTTLEAFAHYSTTALKATLEKVLRSPTAVITVLEENGMSPLALITRLETANVDSTIAVIALLEKIAKTTLGVTANLEGNRAKTTAIFAGLERVVGTTVALQTTFEKIRKSTLPIITVLELAGNDSTTALSATLSKAGFSPEAILTILESARQSNTVALKTDFIVVSKRNITIIRTHDRVTLMRFRDSRNVR